MRIGVVGTGVAGSVFMEGLANTPGIQLRGFDRLLPGAASEAGTGLNVGPNGMKALRLHRPARHDALLAASWPWRRWFVELTDGTTLIDLNLLDVADEPGMLIRWAELYRHLRAPIADLTSFGRGFEAIEEDAAGRLVPVFRDASGALVREGAFDLLVCADGRYSRLRSQAVGAPDAYFPGIGTWRLLVPAGSSPITDYGQYFNGTSRLLSFRVPGDLVYIAGSFPLPGDGSIAATEQTIPAQRAWFLPPSHPPSLAVAWMIDQLERHFDQLHWARTQDIAPLHRMLDDRVLLLGDAAHAVVQTLGQGATQAIEDGVVAANVVKARPATLTELARAYEAIRAGRITFVRDFSRDASDTMLPGADPVSGTLMKAGAAFQAKLRRLYTDIQSPRRRDER